MSEPAANTDRELYREDTGDPAGSYYENSLQVTADGAVGMNVGGTVIVQPIADWHAQASAAHLARLGAAPAPSPARDRYAQCDDTCTVDCGACKGLGRPLCSCWPHPQGQWHFLVGYTHRRDCRLHPSYEPPDLAPSPAAAGLPDEDECARARRALLGDAIADDQESPVASAARSAFRLGWESALAALAEEAVKRAAEELRAAAEAIDRDDVIADLVLRDAAGPAIDVAVRLVSARAHALLAPVSHDADGGERR